MNQRLTAAAAIAVILACASEFFLIHGVAWLIAAIGAVTAVALAGLLTRLAPVPAACGATALAVLAMIPMFAASAVALKVGGAAIAICCAASATSWRALRAVAGLTTYLAALLLYLNALWASSRSLGLIVPTKASLHHLLVLASNGMAQAKNSPPVTETAGVIVLAAGSIGLAAIVIDFLAVRLHRPAIAGLPLLVIYLAPLATAAHVHGLWGIMAFLAAAVGYLGLLASDGRTRLRSWGRVISVWHRPGASEQLGGADVAALAATGRRIGVAALCAAVVAPVLLPTLNLHRLFASSSSGHGSGGGVLLLNPVVQLHGMLNETRPRTVLTYGSSSASQGQYLQVYVLNYDQAQGDWEVVTPGQRTAVTAQPLLPPPGVTSSMPRTRTTLKVSLDATGGYSSQLQFLPVPYWPERLTANGTWWESYDTLMIFANQSGQQIRNYTVTSGQAEPTPDMLKTTQRVPQALSPYLTYLNSSSPVERELAAIARRVTAGKRTAFDKAVALERWFHSGKFTYTLQSTIPDSPQGLLDFLTTDPQGYCQQFAFAMAVLARLLGIPSRVAIGYTGGSFRDGRWVVTTADAHAWPELYIVGAGWLRFEPTPGGSLGQGTAVEPPYVTKDVASKPTSPGKHGGGPAPSHSKHVSPGILDKLRHEDADQGVPGRDFAVASARKRGNPLLAAVIALAAALLVGTAVPGTARIVIRRRRWRTAVSDLELARAAWREVRADLVDLGMPCRESDSPRAVARRVRSAVEGDEAAQQAVGRITTVVERAYYAQAPASAESVRGDVALVRRSLASSARWRARWRARLLPASVLGPARTAVAHSLGSFTGWAPATREEATAQ